MSSSVDSIDKFGRRRKSYQSKVVRMPSARSLKVNHEGDYDLQNKRLTQVGAPQHESDAATMKYVTDCIEECGSSLHTAVNKSADIILASVQEGVKKEIKRLEDSFTTKYDTLHENIKDSVQLHLKPVYEHIDSEIRVLRDLIKKNGDIYTKQMHETTDFIISTIFSRMDEEVKLLRSAVDEKHAAIEKNMHKFVNKWKKKTIVKGYGDLWQIDLAIMHSYARENRGFKYILVVVDCYSRFAWTEAVKTKTGVDVTRAMEKVLKRSNYIPNHIQSDQGGEFFNRHFSVLMKKYGIIHYSTYSVTKAAFAERLIRTLKDKLYKEFSLRGSYKWYGNIIQGVVKSYNETVHHATVMRPVDVTPDTRIPTMETAKLKIGSTKHKYHVGDVVRISKHKIKPTKPPTYFLEDIDVAEIKGAFYEQELQKAMYPDVYLVERVLRHRRGATPGSKEHYVKWLGLSKKHNSWITDRDIV
ncbi:hypothetical protein NQ315_010846 [Exocentrus adspersus]|uniref:Integrase catalytic domain-containing protein n=1 Tax=Exocentrus adspersus TaxID=1586481 RepID=A0AAV8VBD6_9CUCU|nr:hypothetical protein NQ315_010846 [Exocentrus adspersus]